MQFRTAICLAATALLPPAQPSSSVAEVVHLRGGGQIEGQILNEDEYPRTQYVIQTDSGARLAIGADQVQHVARRTAEQAEYDRLRPTVPDTAQGHWQLAQWCTA